MRRTLEKIPSVLVQGLNITIVTAKKYMLGKHGIIIRTGITCKKTSL